MGAVQVVPEVELQGEQGQRVQSLPAKKTCLLHDTATCGKLQKAGGVKELGLGTNLSLTDFSLCCSLLIAIQTIKGVGGGLIVSTHLRITKSKTKSVQ